MKIDMLEVKKDRVKEIDKQIKKCFKFGNWSYKKQLDIEKEVLLEEIKDIESKRGVII